MKATTCFIKFVAAVALIVVGALVLTSNAGATKTSSTPPANLAVTPVATAITEAPVVTVNLIETAPVEQFDLRGHDQYKCDRLTSSDMNDPSKADKCLDGPNQPVYKNWNFQFLPMPVNMLLITEDLHNGNFLFLVNGNTFTAPYGYCQVVAVKVTETSDTYPNSEYMKFTACFVKSIWYFRFHY